VITEILGSIFGITVPLSLIVIGGRYVYLSGELGKGVFLIWGLLACYFWIAFFLAILVVAHKGTAPDEAQAIFPDDGRGVFAITIMGWFPGIIGAGIAMGCRALWRKPLSN
jgi:hypothetical protein